MPSAIKLIIIICTTVIICTGLTAEDLYLTPDTEPLPQEKFTAFRKELEGKAAAYQNKLFEMGLNSDNILIFNHSINSLLERKHFAALSIFEKLLTKEGLSEIKKDLLFTNYQKLKFHSLNKKDQALLLKKILHEQSPDRLKDLYLWAIDMFGEVAENQDAEIIRVIHRNHPEFTENINTCLEKIKLNTNFPHEIQSTEKYIAATRNNDMKIRLWGLQNLSLINSEKSAEYLRLLYEQGNFTMSKREFLQIEKSHAEHMQNFPELYRKKDENPEAQEGKQ